MLQIIAILNFRRNASDSTGSHANRDKENVELSACKVTSAEALGASVRVCLAVSTFEYCTDKHLLMLLSLFS